MRRGTILQRRPADRRVSVGQTLWYPAGGLALQLLDSHLTINCNRDPREGLLDVGTEDNFNQRLI